MNELDIYISNKNNEIADELFKSINDILKNNKKIDKYLIILSMTDENIYEIKLNQVKFIGFFDAFIKINVLDESHFIKYSFINLISLIPDD